MQRCSALGVGGLAIGGAVAFLAGTLDPAATAGIAPDALGLGRGSAADADGRVDALVVLVDGDKVAAEVVLAGEGAAAAGVAADVRLDAVGVVRGEMGLQVEGASEAYDERRRLAR
jgi:hypothetical protein